LERKWGLERLGLECAHDLTESLWASVTKRQWISGTGKKNGGKKIQSGNELAGEGKKWLEKISVNFLRTETNVPRLFILNFWCLYLKNISK
jgi:hypothetical protein